jgi:hypothetical protein
LLRIFNHQQNPKLDHSLFSFDSDSDCQSTCHFLKLCGFCVLLFLGSFSPQQLVNLQMPPLLLQLQHCHQLFMHFKLVSWYYLKIKLHGFLLLIYCFAEISQGVLVPVSYNGEPIDVSLLDTSLIVLPGNYVVALGIVTLPVSGIHIL